MAKYFIRRFSESILDTIEHSKLCVCKDCESIIPFQAKITNSFDEVFSHYMFSRENKKAFLNGYPVILYPEDLHKLALEGSHLSSNDRTGYIAYWSYIVLKRKPFIYI
jgi:hypothetical protein